MDERYFFIDEWYFFDDFFITKKVMVLKKSLFRWKDKKINWKSIYKAGTVSIILINHKPNNTLNHGDRKFLLSIFNKGKIDIQVIFTPKYQALG